ncbi:hypothetical protein [Thomasclavelia ramosa]|uniref:Uncharacterized protein n=1 Tax=Thomasclavelia ramosa TaxID=1547 RepID=A0A3E3E4K9_9FIRM|nr:hypothetical protein [Thomasclavelia ramosa]RGD76139.1 hypothetical protein DXB93_19050 [Thomasclavelia ramosa]
MEKQVYKVKQKLLKCRSLLSYGNASVWDRISSYSTSLIVVSSDKKKFADNRILLAIEEEEANSYLIDSYMNIVNQLDKDARSIVSFAYMKNHYTVNVIASILSMSERNVQRILSDSLRMIAYLDPDIDFTINDLKNYYYYTRNKKNNLVIKRTVFVLIKNHYATVKELLIGEEISFDDLQAYYSNKIESKFEQRKVLRVIYYLAFAFETIEENEFIELMKHTQASKKEINRKLKKVRLHQINDGLNKKNIKAEL